MRIGIDLGGTKIEGVVMGPRSQIVHRERVPTPRDYASALVAVTGLVRMLEQHAGAGELDVGIGHPGSMSPVNGLLRNSNSTFMNGQPIRQDLERALGREVRMSNDANCFALSEAADGAAAGARCVFGVIIGTGCGGGVVVGGQVLHGANGIGGEWGHNPLPWPRPEWGELPGPRCWHGQHGCLETWISGSGLGADHARVTGESMRAEQIVARAESGDEPANATLARYEDRLARALSHVINLLDPDVIVLGGGVSSVQRLYRNVPKLWDEWVFSDRIATKLVQAKHGDSSGVRGAAWLWPA
ncbi:MAG TPA: ROK family protein [Verrucomicrobiae bacterium]|nr:ROK family protein [Verrucomicrobiae bacterium]